MTDSLRPISLSLLDILLAPFRALTIGHIPLLIFEILCFVSIYSSLQLWDGTLAAFITEHNLNNLIASNWIIKPILISLVLFFMLPIIFLSSFAPMHAIWHSHSLPTKILIKDTFRTIINFSRSGRDFFGSILKSLLLIVGSIILFWIITTEPILYKYRYILWIVFFSSFVVALRFGLITFLSFVASVNAEADLITSVIIGGGTLNNRAPQILLVIFLGLLFGLIPIALFSITGLSLGVFGDIIIAFAIWYIISTLIIITLEFSEDFAWSNGRTFRREFS